MAARCERGLFDPDAAAGTSPFDHSIYVIASDGDLQEGVTSEASSLAGHQELGNLIVIYDDNQISIEDDTNIAFTEDVGKRYEAYGWHVQTVDWKKTGEYVEDVAALNDAIEAAKGVTDKPSLIILKTIIGWPSPNKQNTGKIHGSALGADEVAGRQDGPRLRPGAELRGRPGRARAHPQGRRARQGRARRVEHAVRRVGRGQPGPQGAARPHPRRRPARGWKTRCPVFEAGKEVSTRAASGKVLDALGPVMPELWGGSADLAESNNTTMEGAPSFIPAERSTHEWTGNPYGRTLHFGIREHAMGAILNGIVLHGNTRPYGGTFLIFSDYMRPAVRLAALMKAPAIYVWTHDSIAPRRGRPDPPAGRAAGRAAGHPRTGRRAPGRRQRDRLGLEDDPGASQRSGRHRADPPEHPGVRARTTRERRHLRRRDTLRRAPTCWPRPRTAPRT